MATQGDAHRYHPEADRQIPLAVKHDDPDVLAAIAAEYGLTENGAVIALAAVEAHPTGRPVSYSRRKDAYTYAHYRHPLISSYTAVRRGVDRLDELGLINHFRQEQRVFGWQSFFSATDALVEGVHRRILGRSYLGLLDPRTQTILRDANGMEIP